MLQVAWQVSAVLSHIAASGSQSCLWRKKGTSQINQLDFLKKES